jgi:hypothetical protein
VLERKQARSRHGMVGSPQAYCRQVIFWFMAFDFVAT